MRLAGICPNRTIARLEVAASVPVLLANWERADLYVNGNNPIAATPCKRLNWTIVSFRILISAVHVNTVQRYLRDTSWSATFVSHCNWEFRTQIWNLEHKVHQHLILTLIDIQLCLGLNLKCCKYNLRKMAFQSFKEVQFVVLNRFQCSSKSLNLLHCLDALCSESLQILRSRTQFLRERWWRGGD